MKHVRTLAPELGTLSPFEAALIANGDHTIDDAVIERKAARIRIHSAELDPSEYLHRFGLPATPELIQDLTDWD